MSEIRDIEVGANEKSKASLATAPAPEDVHAKAILSYLNQRGYQIASFDRLRRRIDGTLSDKDLNEIIVRNPGVFEHATIDDGRPGIRKLV